jgi:hypothetical protein
MQFRELILQIFEVSKIAIPDEGLVGKVADLEIDGVAFILKDSSTDAENAVELLCDYGEPPKAKRDEILARLMEINFLMPILDPPIYAMDVTTGHVMLRSRQEIVTITALDLLNVLADHAAQIKIWRATYYLKEYVPSKAVPGRGNLERWMKHGEQPH